jgi:conjugative relaxase-like TrwC/TraI family protein
MVATLSRAGSGSWRYYALSHETKHFPGVWWDGGAAQAFGIEGIVTPDQFRNVCHGYSPDGRVALVAVAGSEAFRPGFVFTFLPPKSVSIAWALATAPELRREIEAAVDASVAYTLKELNERCGFSRRGHGGQKTVKADLLVSLFTHYASRANEPLLHKHAYFHNVTLGEDGKTGTLAAGELFRHKMAAGAIFRCDLAERLRSGPGFECERKLDEKGRPLSWFEIKGITQEQIDHFSSRASEIRKVLGTGSFASALAAEAAAFRTRPPKDEMPLPDLLERSKKEGEKVGLRPGAIEALTHRARPQYDQEEKASAAADRALKKLTAKQAHFAERELLRFSAEEAQATGVGAARVTAKVTELLQGPRLENLGELKKEHRYATPETVAKEKTLLEAIDRVREPREEKIPRRAAEKVLAKHKEFGPEEVAAFRKLIFGEERLQALDGLPGTGKTSVLRALAETYEKTHRPVVGCAVAGKAARGLEIRAGIKSHTIFRLLRDLEETTGARVRARTKHHLTQLVRTAVKLPARRQRPRVKLPRGAVLVVDEASMVSSETMNRLLLAAEKKNARVILVGDHHQLQPVDGAAPFGRIRKAIPSSTLTDIRRQTNPADRQNVEHFAQGNAEEALRNIQSRGLLTVKEDRLYALEDLIAKWKEVGVRNPRENVILANTNAEVQSLNERAQAQRMKAKELGIRGMKINGTSFRSGDRVLCTMNSSLGVSNGDFGTIVGFDRRAGKKAVVVLLDSTKTKVTLPVRTYGEYLTLGYAATTHKLQGATVENAWVLVAGPLQDRQATTVQASRHKKELRLVTDEYEAGKDLQDLISKASNNREKTLAHDVIRPVLTQTQER